MEGRSRKCFDLIAGTSTGGIVAAGLALGMSAERMHQFYVDHGAKIFTEREPYKAKGIYRYLFPPVKWIFEKRTGGDLTAAFRARYCPHALEEAFAEGFGENTLGDIQCTRLIMPSVNLTKGEPHVFRSRHLPKAVHDRDIKIADAVIATTAAPTYFPSSADSRRLVYRRRYLGDRPQHACRSGSYSHSAIHEAT